MLGLVMAVLVLLPGRGTGAQEKPASNPIQTPPPLQIQRSQAPARIPRPRQVVRVASRLPFVERTTRAEKSQGESISPMIQSIPGNLLGQIQRPENAKGASSNTPLPKTLLRETEQPTPAASSGLSFDDLPALDDVIVNNGSAGGPKNKPFTESRENYDSASRSPLIPPFPNELRMGTNSPLDWIRGESGIEIPVEQKAPSTAAIQSPKEPAPEKRPADSSIPFEPPPADPQAGDANTAVRGQNEETAEAESRPWWDPLVVTPNRFQPEYWNLGVNELVWYFVQNSPRLRSIQLIGQSSQPAIPESLAEFDPTLFVESNFTRLNDPVGNTLTTGGADRFRDNNWTTRAGLRRKFHTGASLETYQRLGMQTNNSDFFVPEKQGSAYLAINFTQPLLNGRGQLYNDSLIAIAQLESETAAQLAEEKIQTELLDLVKNYWKLYSARAVWIQKQKNADRAVEIYRELSSRKDFDVSQTQLFRAKAAVETRRAELIQARNDIRNIEARISATLGIDLARQRFEIVPKQGPVITLPEVDRGDAIVTAISNRPEILQAGKKVTIEATKTQRTQHELMPVLDLILGTYVSGLNDNFEFINAFGRQFSDGAPGYSAALKFEVPIYRRAAQARLDRQMLRWQAVTAEFQDRILQVESEVDIAVRNVQTSYQRLVARIVATESARAEMDSQRKRLELSLADGENFGNSLNFLLDSQDRLTNQENLLAQAQADYMISWVSLKKAMGTLVLIQSRK